MLYSSRIPVYPRNQSECVNGVGISSQVRLERGFGLIDGGDRSIDCTEEGVITQLYFMPDVEVTCGVCKWRALWRRDPGSRPPRQRPSSTSSTCPPKEGVAFFA